MFRSSRHAWSVGLGALALTAAVLDFVPPALWAISPSAPGSATTIQSAQEPPAVADRAEDSSADAAATTALSQHPWLWVRTERADGTTILAADPSRYVLTFQPDSQFAIKADCNNAGGTFAVSGSRLTLAPGPITAMGCRNRSQGAVFHGDLLDTATFAFEGEQLILYSKVDVGHMVLQPGPPAR